MKPILYPLIALLLTASSCSWELYPVKPAASPYVQLKDGKKYMGAHAGKSGVNTGSNMHAPAQQIVMQNDKLAFTDTAFALKDVAFYCTGNELYAHIFAKDKHTDAFSIAGGKQPCYAFAPQVAAGRVNMYNYKYTHVWLPGLYMNRYYIQAAGDIPVFPLNYHHLDAMLNSHGERRYLINRYKKTRNNAIGTFCTGLGLAGTGFAIFPYGTYNGNKSGIAERTAFGALLVVSGAVAITVSIPEYLSTHGRLMHIVSSVDNIKERDNDWR